MTEIVPSKIGNNGYGKFCSVGSKHHELEARKWPVMGTQKIPKMGFTATFFLFLLWGQTIIKHLIMHTENDILIFSKNFSEGDLENQLVIFLSIFIFNRTTPYVIALVVAKFLHTFGLFVTYEQLKVFHVVQFLFIVRLWYVLPRST